MVLRMFGEIGVLRDTRNVIYFNLKQIIHVARMSRKEDDHEIHDDFNSY